MRKPFIAGNWKMYKTISEAIELVNQLKRDLYDVEAVDVAVCTPFIALPDVVETLNESNIAVGAQDVYWEAEGAFTGEISPKMLKAANVNYCIIGHSERRKYFGETNETVNKKLKALLAEGILPIMCIGESLEEREGGKTFDVLEKQLAEGLVDISADELISTTLAYEPIWAIGTGKTATPEIAQETHAFIRSWLTKTYDADAASQVRIQYGGSVKPDNVAELIKQEDIDGALVGGASLKADSFTALVKGAAVQNV